LSIYTFKFVTLGPPSFPADPAQPPSVPEVEFQLLFESSPGLYLVLLPDDPLFTIVAVSNSYLSATMTRRDRIIGRGIFDVFPDNPEEQAPTGVRNLHASLRSALRTRKPDAMALQRYDVRTSEEPGGKFEERYWSPLNTPVFGEDGSVKFIIHRVEDLTEFVRLRDRGAQQEVLTRDLSLRLDMIEAELFLRAQQLQEANRQLRTANEELADLRNRDSDIARSAIEKSERRYRTLVSATSAIVWTRSASGEFVDPQPSWEEFTGQGWKDCRGWGWLQAIHPDDRERIRNRWETVPKLGSLFETEGRIWKASRNSYCYFVGRGAPIMGSDGSIEEWIGTIVDVDDRRRLEDQLRHTAKLESLGVLAGGIAHDFNNLLTGILGNASLAMEIFAPERPHDRAVLKNIVEAGERAAHLTRQMLAYSGKGSFELKRVDLSDLIKSISVLVHSSVPKNVHLRLELTDQLPSIEADPGQIQQVVMNLIINGAEAIPEGVYGSVCVVTTALTVDHDYATSFDSSYVLSPGEYVSLEVHDTGVGMSEDTKRKIFDPFFTTKVHGRGLGLSAVLGIIRGHKGALRVYSEVGKGSTFRVLLPAVAGLLQKEEPKASLKFAMNTGTVLVIDDEEIIGRTIRLALERHGYRVLLAQDGVAGIELFKTGHAEIALVILDLTMPKISGEETLRQLRAIRPSTAVILSSGYSQTEATRKFVGKGLASFLQKPFTLAQLLASVESAMKGGAIEQLPSGDS
jgi:PAS domain S-box-containing protein